MASAATGMMARALSPLSLCRPRWSMGGQKSMAGTCTCGKRRRMASETSRVPAARSSTRRSEAFADVYKRQVQALPATAEEAAPGGMAGAPDSVLLMESMERLSALEGERQEMLQRLDALEGRARCV